MGHERGPRGTTTVEFLAPDERLFGGPPSDASEHWTRDQPRFGDDRPSSRWGMAIALVGVAAVIAAGVVAAEPWRDDDSSPPPTTVPAGDTESAEPLTSTVVEELGPPGSPVPATGGPRSSSVPDAERNTPWVVTVPDGFTPVDSFQQPYRSVPGWFELWASPRSARTSGRWFAVQVAQGAKPVLVADVERLPFDDGTLLRWTAADGVEQLQFSPTNGYDVRVTAYGWQPEELLEIAASMEVIGGKPLFLVPGPTTDQLVVSRVSAAFGFEQEYLGGEAWSFAAWRDETGRRLTLTVAPAQRDAATVGRFVVTASSETAMSGPDVRRDVGTLNATVGRLPGLDGQYTARWAVGNTAFSLTGDLTIDELLDLARTARPADDVEWGKLQYEVGTTRSTTGLGGTG